MDPVSSKTHNIAAENTSAGTCGENKKSRSGNIEDREESRERFRATRTPRSASKNERIDTIVTASSPSSDGGGTTPVLNAELGNPSQSDQSRHGDEEPVNNTEPPTANQPSERKQDPGPVRSDICPRRNLQRPNYFEFARRVEKLSFRLPHLNVLTTLPTVDSCNISIVDYIREERRGILMPVDQISSSTNLQPKFQKSLTSRLSKGHDRIVMVEDLTYKIMASLDWAFRLDPEMFAEHLIKSKYGYVRSESIDPSDSNPATWNSLGGKKDYVSLRWFRPICRLTNEIPLDHLDKLKTSCFAKWEAKEEGSDAKTMIHKVARETNIFRQERPLSAVPARFLGREKKPILASLEERVTIYRTAQEGFRFVVLLLDPLPFVSHVTRTKVDLDREDEIREDEIRILPFDPVHPRSPPPVNSLRDCREESVERRMKMLFKPRSTREDIELWLTTSEREDHEFEDVIVALLQVVSSDMHHFLRLLSVALTDIAAGSPDDARMQEMLVHWRNFINSYQAELPDIKQSLENFRRWAFNDRETASIAALLDGLMDNFDKLIIQTDKAHGALRAEMSILHSKRSIAEAESVTKLTELAFVYIPLTLAASMFSMQIKELQKNPPSVFAFIVTGVVLTCISYGVRLLIRSTFITRQRRVWISKIRKETGAEEHIRARDFIKWAVGEIWVLVTSLPNMILLLYLRSKSRWRMLILFVFALGGLVPTIATLWVTLQVDVGFKVAITILLTATASVALCWNWYVRGRLAYMGRPHDTSLSDPSDFSPFSFTTYSLFSYRWVGPASRSSSSDSV